MIWFPFVLSNSDQELHSSSNILNLFSRLSRFLPARPSCIKIAREFSSAAASSTLFLILFYSTWCYLLDCHVCPCLHRNFVPWNNFYMRKDKNPFYLLRCTKVMNADSSRANLYMGPAPLGCVPSPPSDTKGAACSCMSKSFSLWNRTTASLMPWGMTPAPVGSSAVSGDCVGTCQLVSGRKCTRNNFQKLWRISTLHSMAQMQPESFS